MIVWRSIKWIGLLFIIAGLLFSSGFFSLLLVAKMQGKELLWTGVGIPQEVQAEKADNQLAVEPSATSKAVSAHQPPKQSASIRAPVLMQNPELPRGCEITSLAMLIQFYGINKSKMDLLPDMKVDPTPIQWSENGTIKYWGNPNTGFVGDITRKSNGYGIYHTALLSLLKKYVPTAIDLTNSTFEQLESQIADGIPVVVWTTIDYLPPKQWQAWDTPSGPIRTTFAEHSVLLVGFDPTSVYVNDPSSGAGNFKINKKQFITSWEAMGKQALSYTTMH